MSQHRAAALLATRACWWAINELRSEHASIRGPGNSRRPGTRSGPRVPPEIPSLAQASEELSESHPGAIG